MVIGAITLFPEMFTAITNYGVTGRACKNGLLNIKCFNPRDYASDNYQSVDDRPFGGGPGMLMLYETLEKAVLEAKAELGQETRVIYMSPQGRKLSQSVVRDLSRADSFIVVSGRYEGIDERFISKYIDEEISLGDYVLSGGELPSMVLIDAVSRLIPGVLGDYSSAEQDSFYDEILDYPQYTRPESIEGMDVPEVLLSGNHESIRRWRLSQSLGKTFTKRPDLLKTLALTDEQEEFLAKYIQSNDCQK
jgi:tRNA (guanine37-N1)-methyltransferase